MRDRDMLLHCVRNLGRLDPKKRVFLQSVNSYIGKGGFLSNAQHGYLQSIYDGLVAEEFGLEPMATDREMATKRAISRDMSPRGK